jgi:periplasmic mercuric ion binding protein
MKKLIGLIASIILIVSSLLSQEPKIADTVFTVYGNCGQCKTRIEKALKVKEVNYVKWDRKTKLVTITYDSSAISLDSLQQRIAAIGHDTEKFKALDTVYHKLPSCCLYRNSKKPE